MPPQAAEPPEAAALRAAKRKREKGKEGARFFWGLLDLGIASYGFLEARTRRQQCTFCGGAGAAKAAEREVS